MCESGHKEQTYKQNGNKSNKFFLLHTTIIINSYYRSDVNLRLVTMSITNQPDHLIKKNIFLLSYAYNKIIYIRKSMQDSISFEFLYIIKIAKFIFVKNDVCFVRGVSFFILLIFILFEKSKNSKSSNKSISTFKVSE